MAFDDNDVTIDVTNRASNTVTSTTTNTANLATTVSGSGNVNSSTNGSGNDTATATDSFHSDSYNTVTDTDHSDNDGSFNDEFTYTDGSETDNSDNSTHDNSIHAGARSYDTGFGDVLGAAGGGDMMIDNRSTILDQSLNMNVSAGSGVSQWVSTDAVVNSGDGAIVAGSDANVTYNVDSSTSLSADGDILMDSTKTVDYSYNSGNISTVDTTVNDSSQDWDLDNAGNTYSATLEVENSFKDDLTGTSTSEWNIDANVIWDSGMSGIADDTDPDVDVDL